MQLHPGTESQSQHRNGHLKKQQHLQLKWEWESQMVLHKCSWYIIITWLSHEPVVEYPSWRHTTVASGAPQESSQIVPQILFMHISTLPSLGMLPPTNLSCPVVQDAMSKVLLPYCHWAANFGQQHTFTTYASIIIMTTAGWDLKNWATRTLEKFSISRTTLHIVQKNWTSALAKIGIAVCYSSCTRKV